ncbi:MAG: ABC transporter ATP-binding protein [Streptosporangiales bacterium]|nr:ABC transporter ATP-binding protein [Streptosporangiales bacterium]MBO0891020.1 ABC transporter ATP-binding protein [Acidothermales bacterium]
MTGTGQASPVLEVTELRRRFGGIVAVDGVSFDVARQDVLGIIGPNGSGKSTLFNLLTGALPPHGGRIRHEGRDITGWKAHRVARAGVGRTFQIPALFVNMTVRENLYAAATHGDWKAVPGRADEVLELLTLGHVAGTPAGSLSGGQQRLLEFGRVLMRDPSLVLLDEVTAGVHPNLRAVILDAVQRLREQGTTFLVIEHDMELVRTVCRRVLVMDAGRVVADGTFAEIASDPQVMEAYLGVPAE